MNMNSLAKLFMAFSPAHIAGPAARGYNQGRREEEESLFNRALKEQQIRMAMEEANRAQARLAMEQEEFGQKKRGWSREDQENALAMAWNPIKQAEDIAKVKDAQKQREIMERLAPLKEQAEVATLKGEMGKMEEEARKRDLSAPFLAKIIQAQAENETLKPVAAKANIENTRAGTRAQNASTARSGFGLSMDKYKFERTKETDDLNEQLANDFVAAKKAEMNAKGMSPSKDTEAKWKRMFKTQKAKDPELEERIRHNKATEAQDRFKAMIGTVKKPGGANTKPLDPMSQEKKAVDLEAAKVRLASSKARLDSMTSKLPEATRKLIDGAMQMAFNDIQTKWWPSDFKTEFTKRLVGMGFSEETAKMIAESSSSIQEEQSQEEGEE